MGVKPGSNYSGFEFMLSQADVNCDAFAIVGGDLFAELAALILSPSLTNHLPCRPPG